MNSLAKENMNIAVDRLKKISETDLADLCNITEQAIKAGGGFGWLTIPPIETLKKYYLNQKDLILLKVETLKLDHLIWEQASDGNMFPHLYSPLELSNVIDEFEISLREDGSHVLPNNF